MHSQNTNYEQSRMSAQGFMAETPGLTCRSQMTWSRKIVFHELQTTEQTDDSIVTRN